MYFVLLILNLCFIFLFFIKGPEENIASDKFGSKTIQGELRSSLLDGDNTSYDMEKGYFII